jgi:hypothetical protein
MSYMSTNNMIKNLKHFSTNLGLSYNRSIRYPTLSQIDFHKSHVIKAIISYKTFEGNDVLTPTGK